MSYVKIIQIVFESILTTTLFFTLSASKCSTIHKIMFTTTFTIVYTFCFVRLRSIPIVPLTILIILGFSFIVNMLENQNLGASNYCALLFLALSAERICTLLSGVAVFLFFYVFSKPLLESPTILTASCIPFQILFTLIIKHLPLFKTTIRKWIDKEFSKLIIAACWFLFCLFSFYGSLQNENPVIRDRMMLLVGASIVISAAWLWDEIRKKQKHHKLEEANRQLSAEVHKSKEFLPSIHKVIQKQAAGAVPRGVQTELARMAQEQELETRCALLEYDPVSATGLYLLDEQLADYRREAIDKDVDLFISVQDPVAPLVENGVITQIRLQRLIGDLMRNAFNAIDRRPSGPRGQILLLLGLTADGCYEIDVCDNGAPFPAWVLENLGVRGTTTGGTGNGMADIFDTLALCKASFTLQKESEGQLYTKHITISFDGTGRLAIDH